MTSRTITILGYVAALLAAMVLQMASLRPQSRIPPLGVVVRRLMRSRTGRVGTLVAWAWLGFHYFAR